MKVLLKSNFPLPEYDTPVNVDAMNAAFINRSHEVWDAMEKERWIYNLDNDDGFVPNFGKFVFGSVSNCLK